MKNSTFYMMFNLLMMLATLAPGQSIPSITAFSPSSGQVGTTVTLTGINFSAIPENNIVYFGATKGTVISATETQLEVIVPAGATHQPIAITANGLTAYSQSPFIVTFPFSGTIEASFAISTDYWVGYQTRWSTVSDVDGDGKTDIVVVDEATNLVSIFRNISTPGFISWDSFEPKVDYSTGPGPYSVATGDLDGDGKPELVVANSGGTTISILRNNSTPGSISFSSGVEFDVVAGPVFIAINDLDLDGKPDIAVASTNNFAEGFVSVLRNTSSVGSISSGSFDPRVDFSAGNGGVWSVALSDIDGDLKPDMAVANGGDALVSIFRNVSTPGSINTSSFETKVNFLTGAYPSILSLADMDGDHRPDLIVGNCGSNTISIFRNTGSPGTINSASFDARIDLATNGCPWNPTPGDVNGDGKLDLLVRDSQHGSLSIFKNNCTVGNISSAAFSPPYLVNSFGVPLGISIADMDGDGVADITLANEVNSIISVFRNTSTFNPIGPSQLNFTNITGTTLTGNFTASPDSPDGYIVIRRIGSSPNYPEAGITYTEGQIIGDDVVVYIGSATTFDDSGLVPGVEYYYNCYGYYGTGTTVDHISSTWAANAAFTIGIDLGPIVTVSPATFTLDDEITITFDATKSYPLNALVDASYVYMYSGVISEGPESANWNSNHEAVGYLNELGENKWSITFIPRYFYNSVPLDLTVHRLAMVFYDDESDKGVSFDGRDIYLPVSPSVITPPQALPATFVSNTGFEAGWNDVYNIWEYRLDVSTSPTFESFVDGYQDKIVYGTGTTSRSLVGGLSPKTNYYYRVRGLGIAENSSIVLVRTFSNPPAASPNVWVKTHGSAETEEEIQSMTSDAKGNIYAAGHFTGTITIGTTTLTSQGEYDIFYVRYDPQGNVVWARSIGGSGLDNEVSLATDANGLYMTAEFSNDTDVDPGVGQKQFWNTGLPWINDKFFGRYNLNDGSLLWAHSLVDASSWSSSSIGVDRSGVYLTGRFYGTVDFDPGQQWTQWAPLTSQEWDIFLAKYSLNGNYIWASSLGGGSYDETWGLLVDATGVYINGYYGWGADFDPSEHYYSLEGNGGFFGRYDLKTGNLIYVKGIGNGRIYSLSKFGNDLYIGGDFFGVIDADPDNGVRQIGNDAWLSQGIVGKYNLLDGSYRWASGLLTTWFIGPRKVIADKSGVYVSGYFGGSADFDPGTGQSNRSSVNIDVFASRFSKKNGSLEWAKGIGSPGRAVSIAATLTDEGYYLGGLYGNTVNFDPYDGNVTRTSSGQSSDIFIARYRPTEKGKSNHDKDDRSILIPEETAAIGLFPNPVDQMLGMEWKGFYNEIPIEVSILDVNGKVLMTRVMSTDIKSFNVDTLSKGFYIFQARQENILRSERFIKK